MHREPHGKPSSKLNVAEWVHLRAIALMPGTGLSDFHPLAEGKTRNLVNRTERGPTAQLKKGPGILMSVLGHLSNAHAVPCLLGVHSPGGFSGTTRNHPFRQVWTDG
jgi:hypothetical protein